jgi:predicted dinucleotide-binding enzyme
MKIGVIGTGMVGNAIASKLVALGHDVMMGSRTADNAKGLTWAKTAGPSGRVGTFAETAAFGELVFNCTQGTGSLAALRAAGAANLDGKIVVDVANVLTPEGPNRSPGPASIWTQTISTDRHARSVIRTDDESSSTERFY